VVQNRAFSKANKWSLGVQGGLIFNDPFLDNRAVGLAVGYHFSEFVGIELLGLRVFSSKSSANNKLEEGGKRANTNPPSSFIGAEGLFSFMYGKLSLFGKKIIYYDMHFIGGMGVMSTETGKNPSVVVGLGQRFYIGKATSLRVDYRMIGYSETIREKEIPQTLGQDKGKRFNSGHSVFLGVDFMFGGGKR
jgi:outer membrane beta-barrel protein